MWCSCWILARNVHVLDMGHYVCEEGKRTSLSCWDRTVLSVMPLPECCHAVAAMAFACWPLRV